MKTLKEDNLFIKIITNVLKVLFTKYQVGEGHRQAHSLQDQDHLDFRCINILEMVWPKESRDMNNPLWQDNMFVVGVANLKDETLHFVILMSKTLVIHLT